jgi:anti-sigma regulatory factor (Ser/Thr protein kinase)
MTTNADELSRDLASRPRGYDHEAIYYGSEDELLAVVVPFLRGGVEAGEPTVVSLDDEKAELVRAAVPESSKITFLTTDELYARPAVAIKAYRDLMAGYVAGGAPRIRILGEVPHAALESTWDWWARYESAVNYAYDEFPLWSMCGYDTRITPRHILDDVARTHPLVATPDGRHSPGGGYIEPPTFLGQSRPMTDYPIQHQLPLAELIDPTPPAVRRAVRDANRTTLPPGGIEDFLVAVSETVTNALRHGRPPVRVRIWTDPDQLVVTVHDHGAGPTDPFAGLQPAANRSTGGLGLWIAHQMCSHVAFAHDEDGFTIRLTATNPRPSQP